MLKAVNLSREFKRNGKKFLAVDGADFQVHEGEMAAVIGQSGSGKSTLFHMISGMIRPTEGEILIQGRML